MAPFKTFAENYGYVLDGCEGGVGLAHQEATVAFRNFYDMTYGGFAIALAQAAADQLVDPCATLTDMDFSFLRSIPTGAMAQARATVVKAGRHTTAVRSEVYADGRLSCVLMGIYCHDELGKCIDYPTILAQAQRSSTPLAAPNEQTCGVFLNLPDAPDVAEFGREFGDIFICRNKRKHADISNKDLYGAICFGLYTNEGFGDANGYIPTSVWAMVADTALGTSAWTVNKRCPSNRLSLHMLEHVQVGATLYCDARVACYAHPMIACEGALWSNDRLVGMATSSFFCV